MRFQNAGRPTNVGAAVMISVRDGLYTRSGAATRPRRYFAVAMARARSCETRKAFRTALPVLRPGLISPRRIEAARPVVTSSGRSSPAFPSHRCRTGLLRRCSSGRARRLCPCRRRARACFSNFQFPTRSAVVVFPFLSHYDAASESLVREHCREAGYENSTARNDWMVGGRVGVPK